jgi:hypothetical protein
MPGLVLTLPQVARLWGFSVRRSEALLSALVADGFLVRDETRAFRRVGDIWRKVATVEPSFQSE